MASYLAGKVVIVAGAGDDAQRGVVVALADGGADVVVAGLAPDLAAEAALNSIANEVWALGRRSAVVTLSALDDAGLAAGREQARAELGSCDLMLRCEGAAG